MSPPSGEIQRGPRPLIQQITHRRSLRQLTEDARRAEGLFSPFDRRKSVWLGEIQRGLLILQRRRRILPQNVVRPDNNGQQSQQQRCQDTGNKIPSVDGNVV